MRPEFREALADLLERYADVDLEEIISDMEIQLEGLKDDLRNRGE